eukprot:sb/3460418/
MAAFSRELYNCENQVLKLVHQFKQPLLNTVEECVALYNNTLEQILDELAPIEDKDIKLSNKPQWFNQECYDALRRRRRAERRYKKALKQALKRKNKGKTVPHEKVLDAEKEFITEIRAAKLVFTRARKVYFRNRLEAAEGNPAATYQILNYLLGKEKVPKQLPTTDEHCGVARQCKRGDCSAFQGKRLDISYQINFELAKTVEWFYLVPSNEGVYNAPEWPCPTCFVSARLFLPGSPIINVIAEKAAQIIASQSTALQTQQTTGIAAPIVPTTLPPASDHSKVTTPNMNNTKHANVDTVNHLQTRQYASVTSSSAPTQHPRTTKAPIQHTSPTGRDSNLGQTKPSEKAHKLKISCGPNNPEKIVTSLNNCLREIPMLFLDTKRGSDIRIGFPESTDIETVKHLVNEAIPSDTTVTILSATAKVTVLNVPETIGSLSNEEAKATVLTMLQQKNPWLKSQEVTVVYIKSHYNNKEKCTVGLRLPIPAQQRLLEFGKVYYGSTRVSVVERFHIHQCIKCHSYDHKTIECNSPSLVCKLCGEDHDVKECTKKETRFCINCSVSDEFKLQANHHHSGARLSSLVALSREVTEHNFELLNVARGSRGGGVALIYRNGLKVKKCKQRKFPTFELLEATVNGPGIDPTRVAVLYRPPNQSKHTEFLDDFEAFLSSFSSMSGHLVITGDFNIHIESATCSLSNGFQQILDDHGWVQHIQEPTHILGGTLDLVLTKDLPSVSSVNVTPTPEVPDHFLIEFHLHCGSANRKPNCNTVTGRSLKKLSIETLRKRILASKLCKQPLPNTVEECVALYNNTLEQILDELAPIEDKDIKLSNKPQWFNQECYDALRRRRRAERRYKKALKQALKRKNKGKTVPHEKVLDAEKEFITEIRAAKLVFTRARKVYFRNRLEAAEGNPAATYQILNYLLGKEKVPKQLPTTDEPETLPDKMMQYFTSKIDKIYEKIKEDPAYSADLPPIPQQPSSHNCPNLSKFKEVSDAELASIIRSMNKKHCPLDPIPSTMVGSSLPELLPIISKIVNRSMSDGVVPTSLKSAVIRPSFKNKDLDPEELSSYRPISNLSFISKILEKCVAQQLTQHIETNKLFSSVQSAYREAHSCETATVKIVNDILIQMDSKTKVILVLLDLSAAFDTISHPRLIQRLKHDYGITGKVLKWIESYLEGRTARVKIGTHESAAVDMKIGVPQGSILGPLLFILYTRDLERIAQSYNLNIHMYADDTQLSISFVPQDLQSAMSQVQKCVAHIRLWMAQNLLKLNPDKTEVMILRTRWDKTDAPDTVPITEDEEIGVTDMAKNLGVMFDKELNMTKHVSRIVQMGNLQLNKHQKTLLVNTLIHSRIDYCNALLLRSKESDIKRLQLLQNAATRLIYEKIKEDPAYSADLPPIPQQPSSHNCPNLSKFKEVSDAELASIIRSMNKKHCPLDPIPSTMVGSSLPELLPIISKIVNRSMSDGVVPTSLKSAVIRPSFKNKDLDHDELSSYRPISNLSFISKILEKCVAQQLTQHIETNKLFSSVQSAYREAHSCETATVKIVNDILIQMDSKTKVILVLLDLSAAFDTISHPRLIQRLKHDYGITGKVLKWIESYLEGRTARVKIGTHESAAVDMKIGVPQGSILGPLLFILYTRDLERIAQSYNLNIHMYADDTQLSISFVPQDLQSAMSQVQKCVAHIRLWMAQNLLKLNPDKTEVMILRTRWDKTDAPDTVPITEDEEIGVTDMAKNLGVMFDKELNMTKHVSRIVQMGNLQLNKHQKTLLVNTLIHSRIDYCNALLLRSKESDIKRLQLLQNAATRFIHGQRSRRGVTELRKKSHFLPVKHRVEFKACLMIYNALNGRSPSYMTEMIQRRQAKAKRLRVDEDASRLEERHTKYKVTEKAFSVTAPKLWNKLQKYIRNSESVSAYREAHSCETATVKIVNDILIQMDSKTKVILVLLDLSAAFDTISHPRLIQRLKHDYGITGKVLKWIESYLEGRTARVKIGTHESAAVDMKIGVPQGSILGPLLFILYTRDLERIAQSYNLNIHMYADDTQLSISFVPQDLQSAMSQVQKCVAHIRLWMAQNLLKLNPDKTEVMILRTRWDKTDAPDTVPITKDEEIGVTDMAKNLGVMFDNELNMTKHVSRIVQMGNLQLTNMWRIASKLNKHQKTLLVNTLIHSRIDYCNALLLRSKESDIKRLQLLQNAATRFIHGQRSRRGVTELRKKSHFLPVKHRVEFKACLMIYNALNGRSPSYMTEMIQRRQAKAKRLRVDEDASRLEERHTKYKVTEKAFSVTAPKLWNKLPKYIRNSESVCLYVSKILEKCVAQQLTQHIETNKLFSSVQSAYREAHSCETATVKIVNDILIQMDSKTKVILVLLDLSAAFDTISHPRLIQRLKHDYGITGKVLKWIESYLEGRTARVKIGTHESAAVDMKIGVPQGSILGPLLFILYTRDLERIAQSYNLNIHMYADDTQLSISFVPQDLQSAMSQVQKCVAHIRLWMAQNLLKLNPDKTEVMILRTRWDKTDAPDTVPITKDEEIGVTDMAKNLGVMSKESDIKRLQLLQNAATRFIHGQRSRRGVTELRKKSHFLPVKHRVEFKACLMIYNALNGRSPSYMTEMIQRRQAKAKRLRVDEDASRLEERHTKYKVTEKAFSVTAPKLWNKLPKYIRNSESVSCPSSSVLSSFISPILLHQSYPPPPQSVIPSLNHQSYPPASVPPSFISPALPPSSVL